MRAWWLVLAACGGGDPDASVDIVVTSGGTETEIAAACKLTESETFFDIYAGDEDFAVEIKWKKALITTAGTYPTGGIVDDIVMFVGRGDGITTATGSVTFETYDAPAVFTGTFSLAVPDGLTATGTFDCR